MNGIDKEALLELGLTNNEIEVYLKLLMSGSITVNTLAERTGLHRQACYDALDRLLEKGFANFVLKDGKKHFQALPPEQILTYADQLKDRLVQTLPTLKKLTGKAMDVSFVEVYKGKNTIRTILRDIVTTLKETREPVLIIGVDETKFNEYDSVAMEHYLNDMQKFGLNEKLLSVEGATKFVAEPQSEYRLLPKEFFNPNPTFIYGNKVVLLIWGSPLYAVMVKSKEMADANRKQFQLLWKIAKPRH